MLDTDLYIGGRRSSSGPFHPVYDKWTGELLANIPTADADAAMRATAASETAFGRMRDLSSFERKQLLSRIVEEIKKERLLFEELIAREAGKPPRFARGEVGRAIDTFTLAMEESARTLGEVVPVDVSAASKGFTAFSTRVPAGPVLAITPFNFPLNLVAHKVAPALASGCSVVLKPPPDAPLCSLLLATCLRRAGAPEDALQVVPCDNETAELLVRDPRFARLSFTGSDRVGWHLRSIAGKKGVTLELGGNAACIVHEDADFDVAVERVFVGAFAYSGQVCIKTQRLYVHEAIAEQMTRELALRARKEKLPCARGESQLLGPLIHEASAKRIESWIAEACDAGARLVSGGGRHGAWVEPTVLAIDGGGRGLRVVDEEVFGPVLTVHTYKTWSEALELADASRFGLQAGLFTDSHSRIDEAFRRLHVGGLIVNDAPSFRVDGMPYGGVRDSGIGREGVRHAMLEMTEQRLLVSRPLPPKPPIPD